MSNINSSVFGSVPGVELEKSGTAGPNARFDIMKGHLFGGSASTGETHLQTSLMEGKCPMTGVDLERIGKECDVRFTLNTNPRGGFTVRLADGKEAADALTQYQIMHGGYDGRKKLLTEFHRAYVEALDDPFVTIDFYRHEESVEKMLGPLPDGIKAGTLAEFREKGWREEARRIIHAVNGYNPVHHEVVKITRRFEQHELTEEEAHFHPKNEDQHLFHEDEILEVTVKPVSQLPRIRYLDGLLHALEQIRAELGVTGK